MDALAVFSFLALRSLRRSDETAIFEQHADRVAQLISAKDLDVAKAKANLGSAFALRDLGKSLAALEFSDF